MGSILTDISPHSVCVLRAITSLKRDVSVVRLFAALADDHSAYVIWLMTGHVPLGPEEPVSSSGFF